MISIYYLHEDNNIPSYIGKTIDVNSRQSQHRHSFNNPNLILEVIDEVEDNEWKFWEEYYISLFKSWGFKLENKNNGGGGSIIGLKRPGTSKAHKGRISPNKGKNKTQKAKQLISKKLKGTPRPTTSKKLKGRISPNKGKTKNKIAKQNISKKLKGRKSPNKGKGKPVNIYTREGKYIGLFDNKIKAAEYLDVHPETVGKCARGVVDYICNKQYKVKYQ